MKPEAQGTVLCAKNIELSLCVCELESVSIGSDNHMYASVIVKTLSVTSTYALHPIIKITKPNGEAFLGGSIDN